MPFETGLIASNVEEYLNLHDNKDTLRFITCGSVDDGKSTLIGRMLYESKMIFDDQLKALEIDSKKFGTTGDALDMALLVDGLSSEREQGITIDVAYRFFSTEKRKFIVADTPGHEQYTCNMATGASNADLAVILVDARKGILQQTRRHSYIMSLMGIRTVVLAINKMDLIDYSKECYEKIKADYLNVVKDLGFETIKAIPVSALIGDNIVEKSSNMEWYQGVSLIRYLETVETISKNNNDKFCMPVQWVNRASSDFRGFAGRVVSGFIKKGDEIVVSPSGRTSRIKDIIIFEKNIDIAEEQESITITLEDEIDISRGDVLTSINYPCEMANQFEVRIIWMDTNDMVANRQYIIQIGTAKALCTPYKLKYKIDMNAYEIVIASSLALNEIGVCDLSIDRGIPFKEFKENRSLGSFILIDRQTKKTVAAGTINHALRRSKNIYKHNFKIDGKARAETKNQSPRVLWLTGLSGSGKSAIADLLEQRLYEMGKHTMILDGDNIRYGLNKDLNFTPQDRAENIRRIAEVAKLMTEAGLIVITSFISPYRAEREMAKELIGEESFIEIFVDTPLVVAEHRDTKGLYKKAREGAIPNFTGIGSPYEPPKTPNIHIETVSLTVQEAVDKILDYLKF